MNPIRHEDDQEVIDAVEAAAELACQHLDELFPGKEKNGITSNFQGELARVIMEMVKGKSQHTELPRLVLDNTFFGNPNLPGEDYLALKISVENIEALDSDTSQFRDIAQVGYAWTSFDAAVKDVIAYANEEELTLDELKTLGISIKAVGPIENSDCGFNVIDSETRNLYPLATEL